MTSAPRVAFVNCGILGHKAMADVMVDLGVLMGVEATHIDLSNELTIGDRVIRRLLSCRAVPTDGAFANLDLRRWRQELNLGWLARRRLRAAERHGGFDVLHFHTQSAAYTNVARMARTPAIVSIDSTSRLASLEASSAAGRWSYKPNVVHDGMVFRAARAIVSTSEWAKRDLVDLYPDCAAKVHVIPYPVRDAFDAEWIAERYARGGREASTRVRALFVGGDFPRKGGADLLDAWRDGSFGDRASLDIVTDWPIAAHAAPPGVRIVRGTVPYTAAWFELWRRADVFVMPTRHEAFGIVYEEAAAAGLPAIGTAINAVPEIIEDDTTGLLVPPGDVAALVRALRALIDSADLRRRLGTAARARVRQRAFPDRYASKLAPLIHSVMGADVHAS